MSAKEDLSLLIAELGNNDPDIADAAGQKLLARGTVIVPSLLGALNGAPASIRRRLVYLVGELGRVSRVWKSGSELALQASLHDRDWKVRRNTAISLGKIGEGTSVEPILGRLREETHPRVRTSLILAFGKLADPSTANRLQEIHFTSAEEQDAVRKVSDRLRALAGPGGKIDTTLQLSTEVAVELWCRAGVSDVVAGEVTERGYSNEVAGADRVAIRSAVALESLMSIRTALFPVLVFESEVDSLNPRCLGREFAASRVASEMKRLTHGMAPYYRLTVTTPASQWRRRREWIGEFVEDCEGLVNAATGYAWEVIVRSVSRGLLIGARPADSADPRFRYRKRDRPASLHPTLAAAVVRLAPTRASDVVLDPFCGSGTLLAERAVRAPYRCLIGLDIDRKALEAAQANLSGFSHIALVVADALQAPIRGWVDLLLTNPPYGQRVADPRRARLTHAALDALACAVLRPGGFLVVFRPVTFPPPRGLKLINRRRLDAGGLHVDLFVACKP